MTLLDLLYLAFVAAIGVNYYGWHKANQERERYEEAQRIVCRAQHVVTETQVVLDAKMLEWDRLVMDAKLANQILDTTLEQLEDVQALRVPGYREIKRRIH